MVSYIVPVLYLSLTTLTYDPSTLVRASILIVVPSILILLSKKKEFKFNLASICLIILIVIYTIVAFLNRQNYADYLHGAYGRNFGILTYFGLLLLFIISSSSQKQDFNTFFKSIRFLTFITIPYAFIQLIGLDPIQWEQAEGFLLTLGNPNFSGALIAILSNLFLYQTSKLTGSLKYLNVFLYLISICLCFLNGSLQSIVIIFLNLIFYFSMIKRNTANKYISNILPKLKTVLFLLTLVLLSIPMIVGPTYQKIFMYINELGNIEARLRYWTTGFRIFQDNWLYGVGIEGVQRHIGQYRQINEVTYDGVFVYSDKLHNVFLDHFTAGGLFAGVAFVLFISLTFKRIFLLSRQKLDRDNQVNYLFATSIWLGYFFQSLLSPDHLVLAALGYLSAGFLFSIPIKKNQEIFLQTQNKTRTINLKKMTYQTFLKAAVLILLVISVMTYTKAIRHDFIVKQFIRSSFLNEKDLSLVLSEWPNSKLLEIVGISEIKKPIDDCATINKVSTKLLEINYRNSNGWYLKTICYENIGDLNLAIESINKAILFDPLNPVYLISRGILEFKTSQFEALNETIMQIKNISPNQIYLAELELLLKQRS